MPGGSKRPFWILGEFAGWSNWNFRNIHSLWITGHRSAMIERHPASVGHQLIGSNRAHHPVHHLVHLGHWLLLACEIIKTMKSVNFCRYKFRRTASDIAAEREKEDKMYQLESRPNDAYKEECSARRFPGWILSSRSIDRTVAGRMPFNRTPWKKSNHYSGRTESGPGERPERLSALKSRSVVCQSSTCTDAYGCASTVLSKVELFIFLEKSFSSTIRLSADAHSLPPDSPGSELFRERPRASEKRLKEKVKFF